MGGGGEGGRSNIIVRWILDFNCINCILLDLYWKAKAFVRNYKRKFQKINGNGDPQFKATDVSALDNLRSLFIAAIDTPSN